MKHLDFMVSIDFYLNETTRNAHLILPPTFALEHDHYDLGFNLVAVRNVAKYSPPVFERGPDQRHDWEICLELATRMGLPSGAVGRLAGRAARSVAGRIGPKGILDLGLRTGPYGKLRGA